MKASNLLLVLLNCYFMLSCLAIERCYCHDPMSPDDTRLLMKTTYEFTKEHNRLFMQRPEWLRKATCISAYGFCPFYLLIAVTALFDAWDGSHRMLITLFIGAKINALFFYHFMEYTDPELPP